MISAAEASARILEHIPRMASEHVPLMSALDYVLSEKVIAPISVPPWRNSSMDGYAVRSADVHAAGVRLRVVGEVPAGTSPARDIDEGEAMRVMTGAPVPAAADSVIRIEDTDRGLDSVQIQGLRDCGRNVRPLGEDYREGQEIGGIGDLITPALVGVLASAGTRTVCVYRRPTVAIVASGDELVTMESFASVRAGDRIISSNSYSLPALVRTAGGLPCDMGIAADTPEAVRERVEAALPCDLLLTTGGISVGDRDFTRSVMQQVGADIKFWRVRIRPGGPIAFGVVDGRPWIGLSGNPVSAMVTFELYVRPALRKMCGHSQLFPVPLSVTLDEPITVSGDLTHFLRVILSHDQERLRARLTGTQSSGALTSMARANALLIVPEGRQKYYAGEKLLAIPLGDNHLRSHVFPLT